MGVFFINEGNKLKHIQACLEKNDTFVKLSTMLGAEMNLGEDILELEKNRKTETDRICGEIMTILAILRLKKAALKKGDIKDLDLKSFKKTMIDLQERIQSQKLQLKISSAALKDDEKILEQDLEVYNQKLSNWEKPLKHLSTLSYKVHSAINTDNEHKAIQEFMDFVNKSKGHENGWSREDHALFMKLRNKNNDIDHLALNLNKRLPDISVDEIKNHELWYRQYLALKDKKRAELDKWRQGKIELNHQESVEPLPTVGKPRVYLQIKDENIQEKLALWKVKKEAKRVRDEEIQQMKREKLAKTTEHKQKMHEAVKASVQKWRDAKKKRAKIEQEQLEIMQERKKKLRAAMANVMIKQFQTQDDIFIARMKSQRKSDQVQVRRSKSSQLVNRDPERIFKPTKTWLIRTLKTDNFVENSPPAFPVPVSNIRRVPKLGIPEWRKKTTE